MQKTLKRYFPIFVVPTLIAFAFAFIIPFIEGVYLSFCKFTTVGNAHWVGLENYKAALTSQDFTYSFWVTAAFTVISVIVLGYTWQQMINAVLFKYGTTIVSQFKYGFVGLIILMNWQLIGYMMIIYIAGLQNIPTELIEAAEIDGATHMQTLFKVKIPMVMPSITICIFLTLSNSFKLFDQNLSLTAGAPLHKTEMLALNIYQTFYGKVGQEGVGQAKAVLFFIIVTAISVIQLYATRKKEVEQ